MSAESTMRIASPPTFNKARWWFNTASGYGKRGFMVDEVERIRLNPHQHFKAPLGKKSEGGEESATSQ